jgi:NYN domain
MKTNVYIDGFNLYFRLLRNSPYKWLNLSRLCHLMLPKFSINRIKYFTAHVSARPGDPDQPTRQQTYLRALRTLPNVDIITGQFRRNKVKMLKVGCNPCDSASYVRVYKDEEKGSDVNLAAHLLSDGYKGEYEAAVVITKDSDLVEPIKMVRYDLGLVIGLLNPGEYPSRELAPLMNFIKPIRLGALSASQFPREITDSHGVIRKPSTW